MLSGDAMTRFRIAVIFLMVWLIVALAVMARAKGW
jgi:hypothetical protein